MQETITLDVFGDADNPDSELIDKRVPPRAFRIFRAGDNETEKGKFLFDQEAADAVQAHAKKWGVDHAIDYAHAMLSGANAPDPAQAGKAAGWFKLSVKDGELWAERVRWTEPAHAALAKGEWRYMSPAFSYDRDTRRVTALTNVALTNVPATHGLDPLTQLARPEATEHEASSMKSVFVALGMPESANEGEALAKVAALTGIVAEIERATGKAGREALGVVHAWRASAEQSAELAKQIATLSAAEAAREIDAAVKGGKLVPAMRDWAATHFATDLPGLRAFLAALPQVVKIDAKTEPVADPNAAAAELAITDEDRKVAKQLGISVEAMAKTRAAMRAAQ